MCIRDRFTRVPPESRASSVMSGTFMEKEIAEIPRALSDTLESLSATDFAPCARILRGAKHVYAVACGTALHAAQAFGDIAESEVRCPVFCLSLIHIYIGQGQGDGRAVHQDPDAAFQHLCAQDIRLFGRSCLFENGMRPIGQKLCDIRRIGYAVDCRFLYAGAYLFYQGFVSDPFQVCLSLIHI